MKIAWKNNKKRPLGIVSTYPNLPFERQNEEPSNQPHPAEKPSNNIQNNTELGKLADEGEPSDAAELFYSFQAQGTKLAEVINIK